MSVFGSLNNYNRPGPGVRKDEPKKGPVYRYFEILGRKFFDLCKLNLIFAVPFLVILGIIIAINYAGITNIFINFSPIILLFPCTAGLTFVTRNYVREEHAFIWGDYIEAVKDNFAKLLLHGIISYLFFSLIIMCISFYLNVEQNGTSSAFLPIVLGFTAMMIGAFMQLYVPLMIVTFDLSLKDIYKNALIFSFTAFPRNIALIILIAVLSVGSIFMIYSIATSFIILVVVVGIMFSFIAYTVNFAIYPVVEKNMIVPYYQRVNKESETNENRKNEEKFYYENGKLYRNYDYQENNKKDK